MINLTTLVTEKSTKFAESFNKYCFRVPKDANKYQIKTAVEKQFDVKVISVATILCAGKKKRANPKSAVKMKERWKKAIVKIKDGQKIELYKNV